MDKNELNDLNSNDRLKIKAIYNRYRSGFLGFGKVYNLGQDALKDIYQEAFLALRKRAVQGKLDHIKSSLKTYLFGIGKYMIFDELKRRKNDLPYDETKLDGKGEEIPEIKIGNESPLTENQKTLRICLKKLGEKCRQVLTLFYYRGLNIKEIAEQAGYRNENVVKAQKSRCMKQLRDCFEVELKR